MNHMNGKQRKYNQFEINDLIDDAVNNAIARRGVTDSQDDFSALSDEEATKVAGGLQAIINGIIINPNPPIVNGVIIKPEPTPPKCVPILIGLRAADDII
jgi:hypothetical protein